MNINKIKEDTIAKVQDSDTVVAVFHNNLNNCRYTFKNGKDAIFLGGSYQTRNQTEIEELMEEIKVGHDHISIDPNKTTVETKMVDPMTAIREKLMQELREAGQLIEAGEANFGNSDQNIKMNITTSRQMNDAFNGVDRTVITVSQQSPIQEQGTAFPVPAPANVNIETVEAINTIGIDPTTDELASKANQEPVNQTGGTVVSDVATPVVTDDENKVEKRIIKVGPQNK